MNTFTPEQRAKALQNSLENAAERRKYQQDNTHELPRGYVAMPTITPKGVGWELHPPEVPQEERVIGNETNGPLWFLRDLKECEEAVERHFNHYHKTP